MSNQPPNAAVDVCQRDFDRPVDTSQLPYCVACDDPNNFDFRAYAAQMVEIFRKGEAASTEWFIQRMMERAEMEQVRLGCLRLTARMEMNRRNRQIDALRLELRQRIDTNKISVECARLEGQLDASTESKPQG